MSLIYLDNNATTQVDPRVVKVMLEELEGPPINPSSSHRYGQRGKQLLANARERIASYLAARPSEILFTSGGTEGLNLLIRGFSSGHILSTDIEHSSVFKTLQGRNVTFLKTGVKGAVDLKAVEAAITPATRLCVFSAVNSQTGVKNPIEALALLAQERKIHFVVDGVALLGKEPFTIPAGVSAMAFSGHKFHGPKGTGFVFVRANYKMEPLLTGGDQESGRRAGTENLAGILGLAKAVELLKEELPEASKRMHKLRTHFETALRDVSVVLGEGERTTNTMNLAFPGIEGELLLIELDLAGILASHGSACASGALEPSRVLINMGYPRDLVRSSIRFSLSRLTTQAEIDEAIARILPLLKRLRSST